jgi:muramoyltetrapeptide carboxypeptidase
VKEIIKPPRLHPGATLGVVAPGGEVDSKALHASIEVLKTQGYRVKLADGISTKKRYLAGLAVERGRDIMRMFSDPEVDAILAARGGYGSIQILPLLDRDLIRQNPKAFVGYSDVTILLNWMVQSCGLVAFHGPMAVDFSKPDKRDSALDLLSFLSGTKDTHDIRFTRLRNGTGRGRLIGGCLTVLLTTLGTPYEIATDGMVLFVEDVAEKPYRLERGLDQLKVSGKLDRLHGVIFGDLSGWAQNDEERAQVVDIVEEIFSPYPYPVGLELRSGHASKNLTLPLGVNVVFSEAKLSIEESPFSDDP